MLWPFQLEKRPDRLRIVVTSHSRTTGHRLLADLSFSLTWMLKIPCIFDIDIDITALLTSVRYNLHIWNSIFNPIAIFFQNPVIDQSYIARRALNFALGIWWSVLSWLFHKPAGRCIDCTVENSHWNFSRTLPFSGFCFQTILERIPWFQIIANEL